MEILKVEHLKKTYGEGENAVHALDDVSFSVEKGEFVAMPQARAQTMHYMKGLKGAAALRRYCCTLTHLEDLDELIDAVFEEQRKAGLDPDDVREVPFP